MTPAALVHCRTVFMQVNIRCICIKRVNNRCDGCFLSRSCHWGWYSVIFGWLIALSQLCCCTVTDSPSPPFFSPGEMELASLVLL